MIVLIAFLLAGLAFFSLAGFVFFIVKLALWTVLLPLRILFKVFFKVLMIPVWLTLGAIGMAAGVALLPILLIIGVAIAIVGVIVALVAALVPLIPFILLGLAIWALVRKRPATA